MIKLQLSLSVRLPVTIRQLGKSCDEDARRIQLVWLHIKKICMIANANIYIIVDEYIHTIGYVKVINCIYSNIYILRK